MQILFDGQCAMCNSFIIQIDKIYTNTKEKVIVTNDSSIFHAESNYMLKLDEIEKRMKETIIVCKDEKIFTKSRAIEIILKHSSRRVPQIAGAILQKIPCWIADIFYSLIASARRIIPIKSSCKYHLFKNITLKQ